MFPFWIQLVSSNNHLALMGMFYLICLLVRVVLLDHRNKWNQWVKWNKWVMVMEVESMDGTNGSSGTMEQGTNGMAGTNGSEGMEGTNGSRGESMGYDGTQWGDTLVRNQEQGSSGTVSME